jgi:hypothetical protein
MMSKHIRMLNPIDFLVRNDELLCPRFAWCYVMPCDCAGPGGCNHYIACHAHYIG